MFRADNLALDSAHRKSAGWTFVLGAGLPVHVYIHKRRHLLTGGVPPISGSDTGPHYEEM